MASPVSSNLVSLKSDISSISLPDVSVRLLVYIERYVLFLSVPKSASSLMAAMSSFDRYIVAITVLSTTSS